MSVSLDRLSYRELFGLSSGLRESIKRGSYYLIKLLLIL